MFNATYQNYLELLLCIGLTCLLIFLVIIGVLFLVSIIQEEIEDRKKVGQRGSSDE